MRLRGSARFRARRRRGRGARAPPHSPSRRASTSRRNARERPDRASTPTRKGARPLPDGVDLPSEKGADLSKSKFCRPGTVSARRIGGWTRRCRGPRGLGGGGGGGPNRRPRPSDWGGPYAGVEVRVRRNDASIHFLEGPSAVPAAVETEIGTSVGLAPGRSAPSPRVRGASQRGVTSGLEGAEARTEGEVGSPGEVRPIRTCRPIRSWRWGTRPSDRGRAGRPDSGFWDGE